jgi:hypothetical protein
MSPDSDCISCRISTIKATARIKHQSTPLTKPGQVIYVDILPPVSAESLTPKSHFLALLILVDAFSRFTRIIGMPNKSSQSVIAALTTFAAEHRLIKGFAFWDIEKIKSDPEFVPSVEDCSKDEETTKTLQEEYGIDFALCVGALLYLSYTRPDITYAVVKFAKYTRHPGEAHMEALLHLLRYLRDSMYLGLKYYSDITMSSITRLLSSNGISLDNPLCTFTDSSWNDDVDTGRSSGCFMIIYMGGVVEHSSNIHDPVALSSAEAEYNEACLACMATAHLKQFLEDLELP